MESDILKEMIENKIAFVQRMGLKVSELRPGYVKLEAPLKGNENHFGSMYAGALFTLAEIPGGALAISTFDFSKYYPVVKEMNIRFRRPAAGDAFIEISLSEDEISRILAEADANGKAEYVLSGKSEMRKGRLLPKAGGCINYGLMGNERGFGTPPRNPLYAHIFTTHLNSCKFTSWGRGSHDSQPHPLKAYLKSGNCLKNNDVRRLLRNLRRRGSSYSLSEDMESDIGIIQKDSNNISGGGLYPGAHCTAMVMPFITLSNI